MREFERIASFFAPLTQGADEAAGLLDDAAFIKPKTGETWVVTTDAISEGIHYLKNTPPELIARKLLRTNLSDLAAKGASPRFYTLNIMIPDSVDDAWIRRFAGGLMEDQRRFHITLIGGDSIGVQGEHASFSMTAFGVVANGVEPLKRSGAQVGDKVCVSGVIGEAAVGLKLAKDGSTRGLNAHRYYQSRYELPEPRLAFGQILLDKATSCMDLSDGLVQDAGHIARASGKRLVMEIAKIPVTADMDLMQAMTHGDDYELLFTLSDKSIADVTAEAQSLDISIAVIGRIEAGEGVVVLDASGIPVRFNKSGWQH